ncbi:MAG: LLM class flavin-dependent oxidoreductase [Candidatus Bathyarchaeia archaeon]
MKRLGVVFWGGMSLTDLAECAKIAEQMGYDSVWTIEFWRDAFGLAFSLASVTDRIKIGVGIANIHARSAFTTALTANALDEFSNGRCSLGIGTGPPEWAKDYHNARWTGKYGKYGLRAMAEYAKILKQLMTGDTVSFSGEIFRVKSAQLGFDDPASRSFRKNMSLYIAATGHGMTEAAGRFADGVLWNLMVGDGQYLREVASKDLAKGANTSGRNPESLDVGKYLIVSVADESAEAQRAVKPLVAFYATKYYNKPVLEWHGFKNERAKMIEAYKAGESEKAASLVTSAMVEKLTAAGTVEQVRSKIDEYIAAGVKLPIFLPAYSGSDTKQAYLRIIEQLAP